MMRLTLSTREEEALRRHMLRVGAAARFKAEPPTPKPPAFVEGGADVEHHAPHSHPHSHAHASTAHSVGHSAGASADDARSHASFAADDSGMSRYHDALRATGHKLTERYVPSGGGLTARSGQSGAQSSRRTSSARQPVGGESASVSGEAGGGYNRHVHHSYGSLPVRSAATESYVQQHSPPDDITPGGLTGRSRTSPRDGAAPPSARHLLVSDYQRGTQVVQPLPPLADPLDRFPEEEDVSAAHE